MSSRPCRWLFLLALSVTPALAACGSTSAAGDPGPSADVPADAADLPDALDAGDAVDLPDAPPPQRLVDQVNPLIGSGGQGWWAGNVSVGAQAPFGMVQAGPDGIDEYGLPWDHCAGYNARDTRIQAFSHEHLHGTGIPDMGAVGFMPFRGSMEAARLGEGHWFGFDKATETARPGYYAVTLADPGVRVELTASEVAAMHRYSFPTGVAPGPMTLLIDLAHTLNPGDVTEGEVEVRAADREVRVRVHNVGEFGRSYGGMDYFLVVRADRPLQAWGSWKGTDLGASVATRTGADTGAWLTFDASDGVPVGLRVGLSYVDMDGAARNLADLPPDGFDATLARTQDAWERVLGRVRCSGGDEDRRRTFYTALYHAHMMPNRFMDVDDRYRGLDKQVHTSDGTVYHTNFSLWDTYRGQHSLLMLLQPERQRDLVRSLVRMVREGGYLPK